MPPRSLGHRAPLLWIVLPLMAGVGLGPLAGLTSAAWPLAGAFLAALVATITSWRKLPGWAPAMVAAMILAGLGSYASHRARPTEWEALPPREARLSLEIERTFPQGDPRRATGLATVVKADGHLRELVGQRLHYSLTLGRGDPPLLRGATIATVGVLVMLPAHPAPDTFDAYLADAGLSFRLTRGRLVTTETPASAYRHFCDRAEKKLAAILRAGIGEKQPELGRVLRAMMLGQKHELSDEQNDLFMHSGTMHLFAISGLHIGVIALAFHALLALLRLPKLLRFVLGLTALWLYVDITGAAPSAVRAFLMVALIEASVLWRVPGNPVSALSASALIVLLAWPLQLFSASFQLSYGIVATLLLLGLPLADAVLAHHSPFADVPQATWNRWQRVWAACWRKLVPAAAIGIASTLISTWGSVRFFQLITPAAFFANLLLIPAATVVIWAGLASLLCGLLGATGLSALFNHAAVLMLRGIDAAVRLVVEMPAAWHPARFVSPWMGSLVLFALIASVTAGYAAGWKRERGGWWPPFAVLGLALVFGVDYG